MSAVAPIPGDPKVWEAARGITVAPGARLILALEPPEGVALDSPEGEAFFDLATALHKLVAGSVVVVLPHGARLHVYEGEALCGHADCRDIAGMAESCEAASGCGLEGQP